LLLSTLRIVYHTKVTLLLQPNNIGYATFINTYLCMHDGPNAQHILGGDDDSKGIALGGHGINLANIVAYNAAIIA
jgi:hypothetical protein